MYVPKAPNVKGLSLVRSDKKIQGSPAFPTIIKLIESQYDSKGIINSSAIYRAAHRIDPKLSYNNIQYFAKKWRERVDINYQVERSVLRAKKKKIANKALQEVVDNPKKLQVRDRIKLGSEASNEELQEEELEFKKAATRKELSLMEGYLDSIIYGETLEVSEVEAELIEPNDKNLYTTASKGADTKGKAGRSS